MPLPRLAALLLFLPLAAACGGAPFEAASITGDDASTSDASAPGTDAGGNTDGTLPSDAALPDQTSGDAAAPDGAFDAGPHLDAADDSSSDADATSDASPACPSPPDTAKGAFVSPSSSLTTGCGAIDAPCATIAAGLTAAASLSKTIVYLDKGTYPEHVVLSSGVTLSGGWIYAGASTWQQQCSGDPEALAVIAPTSGNVTVAANAVTAGLDTLTVKSKATALAGESLYGVFASGGANLTLTAVAISVASGGDGAPGGIGPAPVGPVAPCAASDGKSPAPPANGKAQASSYSSAGFTPGNGTSGAAGGNGDDGTAAPGPTLAAKNCVSLPACSPDELSCIDSGNLACAHAGTSGCGGAGGAAGLGGGGGGASFAIFAWASSVDVRGGKLGAGNGGAGGSGGAGHASSGTWTDMNGQAGGNTALSAQCKFSNNGCVAPGVAVSVTPPGPGGPGGQGAAGSSGASGAGGDAYSYYAGGGATVTLSASPALTYGTAGTSTGGVPGPAGHAGAHN